MKCFSSAYLAFFFTDCLMSRWYASPHLIYTVVKLGHNKDLWVTWTHAGYWIILLKVCNKMLLLGNMYPTLLIATIVRLLTISSINAYTTSWILYLSGGSEDPRLLLPAWICIASVNRPSPFDSRWNILLILTADINNTLPFNASAACDSQRNISINIGLLNNKLH